MQQQQHHTETRSEGLAGSVSPASTAEMEAAFTEDRHGRSATLLLSQKAGTVAHLKMHADREKEELHMEVMALQRQLAEQQEQHADAMSAGAQALLDVQDRSRQQKQALELEVHDAWSFVVERVAGRAFEVNLKYCSLDQVCPSCAGG